MLMPVILPKIILMGSELSADGLWKGVVLAVIDFSEFFVL
jgi:hypothetical protein